MRNNNKNRIKKCVFIGCDNKAIAYCNNCNIPVCEKHGKRIGNFVICMNCAEYLKRQGLLKKI